MAKASIEDIGKLEGIINDAATGLKKVTSKKMFGCHALFANDAVFGLVWKEGRIGVRLPEEASFEKLMALSGSVPWKAGAMTMSHWVLVPPSMHKESAKLSKWLGTAHSLALTAPKKAPPKKKATTTKPTPKRKAK